MLHKNNKVRIAAQFGLTAVCVIFFVFLIFAGEAKAAIYQCDSCSDCRSKISSAGAGDTIELIKDIWNTADLGDVTSWEKACIVFNNKQNIIFDCGHCGTGDCVIDGTSQNYGIYFSDGSNSNTIKNCYITGFQYGIYVNYADSINFSDVTANYNIDGIYFKGSDSTTNSSSNILNNITANNNSQSGIYFEYSKSNILNNITANNNGNGIKFQNSGPNTLNVITANNNGIGIRFLGASAGNNLTNITANSNSNYGIETSQFNSGSFTNVIVNGNKNGILLATSNLANILTNITAVNNSWPGLNNYGIQFNDSDNNIIKDSVIKWNGGEGGDKDISVDALSSGNIFYNNQFISKDKIKDDGTGTVWDKIGEGNLWEVFDQDSEGCFDINSNNFCDDGANPADKLYWKDNHPKRVAAVSAHYCNSRDDCNTKIAFAKAGDTVYLTKDILNYAGNCINLQNKTNLIFDCQGYTIDKDAVTAGNGVYLDNGGANGLNTVKNCVITDFTIGVYAFNSNQNTASGNTVKTNTADIKLTVALNNVFYDNEFLNQGKITDEAGNGTAWDNGAAGNHWEGYDEPVETCVDVIPAPFGDGYCDTGYTLISSSGAVDNYPKYNYGDPYTCSSCADCTAKISAASPGDTIKLTKSIADYSGGNCVEFSNKQNITFNCQGYGIDGVGAASSYGVYILGAGGNDNNTVKNCYITAFTSGVYANNSNGNNFDNIAANYNTYGLYFSQSSSNIFKNSIAANYNTGGYGLYFSNSNSNALTDPSIAISANNNARGIYFSNSGSNELINLTANNNSDYGVYFSNSSSNILSNVAVNYNATAGMHFSLSGNNMIKDSAGIKLNPVNINIASDNGVNGNKFYNNDFVSKNKITDLSPRTQWDNGAGAGNWWQSYDSGDEGCVDGGGGICDAAYAVGSLGTRDDFPEWKKLNDDDFYCTDCASCSSAIAGAMYGDEIILDNHIFGGALACRTAWDCSCIDFGSYKEGLTFKSGGDYIIQGPGNYYGIRFDGYNESNTIKNVIISNFNSGIILVDKGNKFNVFSDIMSSYNIYGAGVSIGNDSNSNTLTKMVANNNTFGIIFYSSSYNTLTYGNLFNNGNSGVYLNNGGSHTIVSSTVKLNATDVYINGASNNLFYNNQFTSKTKINDMTVTTIWDNGVKGNWWEAYDSDDDGCFDNGSGGSNPIAGDQLCDNKYEVEDGIYDRYPQYKGGVGVVYTCSTCAECNSKIIQAKYGDTVQLTQDIFGAPSTCFEFNYKQGITFDCQNHTISGQSVSNTYGVQIKGNLQNDYNTVKKCAVSKFNSGVYIEKSYANTLDNVTADTNSYYGVYLKNSNFNTLTNVAAKNHTSYSGIYLDGSDNNQLSQITVNNNETGIYFLNGSDSNSVTTSAGIKSNKTNIKTDTWSYGNIFYNNQFTSKTKIDDSNTGAGNNITHWNKWDDVLVDQQPGNHWESYDTVEEVCSDDDANGYCDATPYWKDKFPKYYGVVTDRTCDSCETCNAEITNAMYGEKITLTQDIIGVSGDCVKLNYKEGITFDCDSHKIVGTGAGNGILVKGYGAEYNTIINCDISSFGYGIYVERSGGNAYKNIVANYNGTGINFWGFVSPNNQSSSVLKDMTVRYNTQGIYLGSGDNNVLTNIAVSNNNGDGISISSQQNYLNNITAEYNNGCCNVNCYDPCAGIKITGSNNTASSSIIRFNEADIFIPWSTAQSNIFYNNEFISKDTITDNGTNTRWNDWNGANIAPGNHWDGFDDADECYDDGGVLKCCTGAGLYCDNAYKIDNDNGTNDGGVSVDNYPKRAGAAAQTYTCETCADCSAKIASSTAGDTVKLTKDIIGHSGTCVDFGGKSGVIFDCGGCAAGDCVINGNNTSNSYGVYVTGSYNTVKNCDISNFYNGIYVYNSPSNILLDINSSNNSSTGVYVDCANTSISGNVLENITANNNTNYGLWLQGAGVGSKFISGTVNNIIARYNNIGISGVLESSIIKNSVITNNKTYGLSINYSGYVFAAKSYNNIISSNIIKWNTDGTATDRDIIIDSSYTSNQTFYGNDLTSKNMITDSGTNTKWDNGATDGGNHWDGYDSDDEGCKDIAPINGYCDSAYAIDGNSIDNYPKYIGGITIFYCNSCADCNVKIASSSNGSTIYLANDISNQAGDCLNLSGKQNITFNCQGYGIDGDADAVGNAVYLANGGGNGGNTVKNCVISDFNNGIYIAGSAGNTIALSTVKTNINKDAVIFDNLSSGNIFYSNEFLNKSKMSDNGANTHWNSWSGAANQAPGNHWQGYDEPAETCNDAIPAPGGDGYCDAPYIISSSGAADNYAKYIGAASQYECDSCSDCNDKIVAAGSGDTIKLTANIINQSGDCVTFNNKTPGIIFDCQNYAINGDNASLNSKGILLNNSNINNRIKNCKISGFHYGVYFNGSDFNYLENSSANDNKYNTGNKGFGVYFTGSKSNNLTDVTANNNYNYGVYFNGDGVELNMLTNITANYNGDNGVYFEGAKNNTVTNSEIKWNKVNIKNTGSTNTFYNNKLISKEKIDDTGAGTLWDNGVDTGNWWEAFDGDNENCFNDGGNICTTDYEVESGRSDSYPQYKGADVNKQNKTCDSCANCSSVIQSAYYGEKVLLSMDINTAGKDCVDFGQYKEGITMDCQSLYYISGTGGSGYKGVYIHGYGAENNKVENCGIIGFYYGVDVDGSEVVKLNDVAVINSSGDGIYIHNSKNNLLNNISANYNSVRGIYLNGSSNILSDITANNNSTGLYLSGTGQNILSAAANNIFKNNSVYGVEIGCSDAGAPTVNAITKSIVKQSPINISVGSNCSAAYKVANIFYDNEFISKEKIKDLGETTEWDNGATGNWWEAFDWGDEFCYDDGLNGGTNPIAGDWLCDNRYEVETGVYDEYPKYKGPPYNQIYSCNSCADCSGKIQNARYGETVNLAQNIYAETDCVNFGDYKEGVIFDCDKGGGEKYAITGGFNYYTGVHIYGAGVENHTVKNCQLNGFGEGVYIDGSDGNKINNIGAYGIGMYSSFGVYLNYSDGNAITNSNLDYNYNGIYFKYSNGNAIDNISANYGGMQGGLDDCYGNQGEGFYFEDSDSNEITNSAVKHHNTNIYIETNASQNNKFYNNHFISEKKMTDNGTGTEWDNGITGNWWEACGDGGGGACAESPYWKDNFPKYEGGEGITTDCVDCDDCNAKIIQAKYGETVRLTQDIFLRSGTCVKFNYKEGVTFDAGGCALGDCIIGGLGSGKGINMCGEGDEYNAIKNFYITNFASGVYIYSSGHNFIQNGKTENNLERGIYVYYSDNNSFQEIAANNNNGGYNCAGIDLQAVKNNILKDIEANYNICVYQGRAGILLSDSHNNTLEDVEASHNNINYSWGSGAGVYLSSSGFGGANILSKIKTEYNQVASAQTGGGIYFSSSPNNIVNYATSTNNNKSGIYFSSSSGNKIANSAITDNSQDGIYFSGSNTNTIASSTAQNNGSKDINLSSGSGNIFHANEFISQSNMTDNGAGTHWNWWVGSADAKPGNHWDNYDTAAECCFDTGDNPDLCGGTPVSFWAYDGYCDNRYEVKTGVFYDNYPIRKSVKPAAFSITNGYVGSLTNSSTCENIIFWENNGDADEYNIYRSTDGIVYNKIDTVDYSKNNYIDSGVDYLNYYSYYIEARNGVFTTIADCDYGGGLRPYCEEDSGAETAALYPTICSADLVAGGVCSAVDLSWADETPTGNYYALRSDDGGAVYNNIYGVSDDNSSDPWTYQDTDASTSIDFYYKIQNCIGACPSSNECQPDAAGPRDNCYMESNIETINPCQTFSMPTWKEVKP